MVLSPLKEEVKLDKLSKENLAFSLGKINSFDGLQISLEIKKKNDIILSTLINLKKADIQHSDNRTQVSIDLNDYNVKLKTGWGKKYDLKFNISIEPALLNDGKLLTKINQEELKVEKIFKKVKAKK